MIEVVKFLKENWGLILLFLVVVFIVARSLIRGYFWKIRKTGKKLSVKEFLKLWRSGVEGITPLQQSRSQVMGTWIVLTGIVCGIIVNLIVRIKNVWYWLTIILLGSLIITAMQQVGALQKYWKIKEVEKIRKGLEDEQKTKNTKRNN